MKRDGFTIVGVGAAACAACCAGPVLAFLGGLGAAGVLSTVFIGGAGLVVAAVAAIALFGAQRRRAASPCAVGPVPVPVELTSRSDG